MMTRPPHPRPPRPVQSGHLQPSIYLPNPKGLSSPAVQLSTTYHLVRYNTQSLVGFTFSCARWNAWSSFVLSRTLSELSRLVGIILIYRLFSSSSARGTTESLSWTDYFAQELYLDASTPDEKVVYHAYLTHPSPRGPLFVTHHGAGSSGLSFAILASELRRLLPTAGMLSIDARGHGETVIHKLRSDPPTLDSAQDIDVLDLSLETLSNDLVTVIRLTQVKMGWKDLPEMVLVGHSLGGAVVTNVARQGELGNRVLGYAVLDVVEGMHI